MKQLELIFVSLEVAKLAKKKGFSEWCPCLHTTRKNDYIPNFNFLYNWDFDHIDNDRYFGVPTHFQLIDWLSKTHKIDICLFRTGLYLVYNDNNCIEDNEEDMFNINKALTVALNQIPNDKTPVV